MLKSYYFKVCQSLLLWSTSIILLVSIGQNFQKVIHDLQILFRNSNENGADTWTRAHLGRVVGTPNDKQVGTGPRGVPAPPRSHPFELHASPMGGCCSRGLLVVAAALLVALPAFPPGASAVGIAAMVAGIADPAVRNAMASMLVEQKHMRAERADLQRQIDAERNSKEVAVEAIRAEIDSMQEQLAGRVNRCEADMHELSNRTCAIEAERKQAGGEVAAVEAETASLVEHMGRVENHRRMQEAAQCQGEAMLAACSPAGGGGAGNGHRRQLQGGCSGFPASCSSERADLFVQYYEVCQGMITAMAAGEQSLFESFFGVCSEKPGPALCAPPSPADIQLWLRA